MKSSKLEPECEMETVVRFKRNSFDIQELNVNDPVINSVKLNALLLLVYLYKNNKNDFKSL
jgi:hypothetical protein